MKRQLLLSLTLAVLAANAYALPAREQAAPQAQASHATVSQSLNTLAADGSDRTPQGQTQAAADDTSDRAPQIRSLASDGTERTPQGQTLAADG
ncbi:hypothetical protein HX881_05445, partial [Pseudomonas gingeri]|nr:hypothetical protein [Pseudomonas gingeri]